MVKNRKTKSISYQDQIINNFYTKTKIDKDKR